MEYQRRIGSVRVASAVVLSILFGVESFLSGCNAPVAKSRKASPVEVTPVGTVSSAGFYIHPIVDSNVSYYMHEQSGLLEPCKVLTTETNAAKKDIYCILDMAELDLYHQKLELNYNSPEGMCKYIRVSPYWFYDFEPVHGVVSLDVTINKNVSGDPPPAPIVYNPNPPPFPVDMDGNVHCPYDYSANNGPNCCQGTVRITTNDAGTGTTSTVELGGKISDCISGPGKDFASLAGYPVPLDMISLGGFNGTLSIDTPSNKLRAGNVYRANYFKPTDYGNGSDSFPYTGSNLPLGILGPPGVPAGRAYYEFGCLDAASDYVARIRVLIRSWSTMANFTVYSNPYIAGIESQFDDPFHDFWVWSDLSAYPGWK